MAVNHLMLSTKADEDEADDLFSALTSLAYVTPEPKDDEKRTPTKKKKKKRVVEQRKHRSRFFFTPTESIVTEVEERKQSLVKTPVEAINQEVEDRVTSYTQELPAQLRTNIEAVREFFVKEIDPKVLGVQGGTGQAMDVVQRTINSPVDLSQFAQFERMVRHARLHKMAAFVVDYMGLPKSVAADLIASVEPKKEVMMIGPDHFNEDRRHTRQAAPQKKVQENEES